MRSTNEPDFEAVEHFPSAFEVGASPSGTSFAVAHMPNLAGSSGPQESNLHLGGGKVKPMRRADMALMLWRAY